MPIRCPHCHNAIEVVEDSLFRDVSFPSCGSHFNLDGGDAATDTPRRASRTVAHFQLLDHLGTGASGSVWKARDTKLDRLVAIKIPRKEQLTDEDLESFLREARAAGQLSHPNIVSVHEVGKDGDTLYIVTDYVEGATLQQWLKGQPLPPREAAKLCLEIAQALEHAHERGVIHRDLKPSNILVDASGRPHLTDFGLARRQAGELSITVDGVVLGTLFYMSPEQAKGKSHQADRRSDVYSLGIILYEMLTGDVPFKGEKQMLIVQIQTDEPLAPRKRYPTIPKDLETICLKCLEKSPERRYQSADELSEELTRFLEGKPIQARRIGKVARAWRWAKRNPTAAILISLILAIAVVGPAVALWLAVLWRDLEETVRDRVNAQVVSLLYADIQSVPVILEGLEKDLGSVIPQLRQLQANGELTDDERLRIRLALVQSDETIAAELVNQLVTTNLSNVPVIATALQPHRDKISETLWQVFHDKSQPDERRFRAGVTLASFNAGSPLWSDEDSEFIVRQLVAANPEHQPALRSILIKCSNRFVDQLVRIFADEHSEESHRLAAARALAFFAGTDGPRLARLASLATPGQYGILFPQLAQSCDQATKDVLGELVAEQPTDELSQSQRVVLGLRRAGAAISLLRLGEVERSQVAFQVQDDPESLTQFVHRCRDRGVKATELVNSLHITGDVRSRFAILLTLGDYSLAEIDASQRDTLIKEMIEAYRTDPSSAIHGATGWLLRKWGHVDEVTKVDHTPVPYDETGKREWYVLQISPKRAGVTGFLSGILSGGGTANSKVYFTFVVFPPGEFLRGSPAEDRDRGVDERLHRVKLTRPLAVSVDEITWAQFDPIDGGQRRADWERRFSGKLQPDDPAFGVRWFEAVEYCRWLTTQAGWSEADQCYEDPQSLPKDAAGNPQHSIIHLDRCGVRLPTEAEWEYVCRSGTGTAYSFGNDLDLLGHYAWFFDTAERRWHVVGQLRPNLRGLFDMHGSVVEWTHDVYDAYGTEVQIDPLGPKEGPYRVLRGGAYLSAAAYCRTATRVTGDPSGHPYLFGFRLALCPSGSASDVTVGK